MGTARLSVQLRRQHLRAHALVAALHRGGMLALALGGGLLVELAGTQLRKEAGFLDGALEAAERHVERLVFLDSDNRHWAGWSGGERPGLCDRGTTHNIRILQPRKA